MPHRAGTRLVMRMEAFDPQGGLVFVEHLGGMLRGVRCVGKARGLENLPLVPVASGVPTPPVWNSSIFIDHMRPFIYDGCSDIFSPIHTSRRFAKDVGPPGIILQGTATLAFAVRELINLEAGGSPHELTTLSCQFNGIVQPCGFISVRLLEKYCDSDGCDLFFDMRNHEGQTAIKNGYARLRKSHHREDGIE